MLFFKHFQDEQHSNRQDSLTGKLRVAPPVKVSHRHREQQPGDGNRNYPGPGMVKNFQR